MTTRYDVSGVPLQGGYVAKQCPVRAQNEVMRPAEPVPPDPFTERLFAHGNSFEAEVVAEILAAHPGAVSVEGFDAGALEAATISAIAAGISPPESRRSSRSPRNCWRSRPESTATRRPPASTCQPGCG